MQKKIIAMAIAGMVSAPAFADSQVNFYGVVDAAVVSVSGSNLSSSTVLESGGPDSTHLGVSASNDLGNGLKAIGTLEYGTDLTNSNGLGSFNARKKMIGLSSDTMGTLQGGWLPSEAYAFSLKFDPFAEGGADPMGAMVAGGAFLIGWTGGANHGDHAIDYTSPNFSGFTFEIGHQTTDDTPGTGLVLASGASNNTGTLASLNYDQGPLSVGGVYATTSPALSADAQSEFALGASYDFEVVKLLGTWQQGKFKNATAATFAPLTVTDPTANNTAYNLSATIPAGPGSFALGYGKTSMGIANDIDGSAYAASYGYPLSKQAKVYLAYEHVTNGSAANLYSVLESSIATNPAGNLQTDSSASSNLLALGLTFGF
ncbi:MAG: porin [Gallionella sp.]